MVAINELLWTETPSIPVIIKDDDPLLYNIQLWLSLDCYKGNCRKIRKVRKNLCKENNILIQPVEFLDQMHKELNDLEETIHKVLEKINFHNGSRYTKSERIVTKIKLDNIYEGLEY